MRNTTMVSETAGGSGERDIFATKVNFSADITAYSQIIPVIPGKNPVFSGM